MSSFEWLWQSGFGSLLLESNQSLYETSLGLARTSVSGLHDAKPKAKEQKSNHQEQKSTNPGKKYAYKGLMEKRPIYRIDTA